MSPNFLFLGLVAFGFLFLAVVLWLKFFPKDAASDPEMVYELWSTILTPTEQVFAVALEKSLPSGVRLLAKVRLSDVFFTRKGLEPAQRTKARKRINHKHVDFLLVRAVNFAPLAGVQLDGQSHPVDERLERDRFVDQLFVSCSLPLLHVGAAAQYDSAALQARVAAALIPAPGVAMSEVRTT